MSFEKSLFSQEDLKPQPLFVKSYTQTMHEILEKKMNDAMEKHFKGIAQYPYWEMPQWFYTPKGRKKTAMYFCALRKFKNSCVLNNVSEHMLKHFKIFNMK